MAPLSDPCTPPSTHPVLDPFNPNRCSAKPGALCWPAIRRCAARSARPCLGARVGRTGRSLRAAGPDGRHQRQFLTHPVLWACSQLDRRWRGLLRNRRPIANRGGKTRPIRYQPQERTLQFRSAIQAQSLDALPSKRARRGGSLWPSFPVLCWPLPGA